MNEKIALDPTACRNSLELKYLLEKFGLSQGRFLIEYPAKWRKQLYEHIAIFPDVEQKKAKVLIERLKDRGLLPAGEHFDSTHSWIENAVQLRQQGKIKAAIGNLPPEALHPSDVDEDSLGDSRSERIKATAAEFVRIALPLLTLSTEVALIDPYLSLGFRNYLPVLQAILKATNHREFHLICFAREEKFFCRGADAIARSELLPYMTEKQTIRFVSLDDDRKMHARYLVSLKGAIKFDKGFQQEPNTVVDVEMVSRTIHEDYIFMYLEGGHGYDVIQDYTISLSSSFREL